MEQKKLDWGKFETRVRQQLGEMNHGLEIRHRIEGVLAAERGFFLEVSQEIGRLLAVCPTVRVLFDIDDTLVFRQREYDLIRPAATAIMDGWEELAPKRVLFGLITTRKLPAINRVTEHGREGFAAHRFSGDLIISTADRPMDEDTCRSVVEQSASLLDPTKGDLFYLAVVEAGKLYALSTFRRIYPEDGLLYIDDAALAGIVGQSDRLSGIQVLEEIGPWL